MLEIRFHGRGGQGAVAAAELLAQAAFLDGRVPQSFPFFGVERRGAPVVSYCRIDAGPIRLRSAIERPGAVVVLDPGLLKGNGALAGLRPGGLLLVNSRRSPERLPAGPFRRAAVDASAIALAEHLGSATSPIVNTAVLGALARVSEAVSIASLGRAIASFVPAFPEANVRAAEAGYAAVRWVEPGPEPFPGPSPGPAAPSPVPRPLPPAPLAEVATATLRTSAWRTLRPEIDLDRCTRCTFCWKFCPDDAIRLSADLVPSIDLEHCKGCGICAAECPPDAIRMVVEEEGT